jgi:uncharacterized membrane protein
VSELTYNSAPKEAFYNKLGPNQMTVTRKTVFSKILSVVLVIALAGCSTDQQRTKTEGTAIGGGVGAVVGGLLGAALGAATGNSDRMAEYIASGAVAGAVIGGMAGYNWGKNVARKKEQYVKTEDYLNACIGDAHACALAAERENSLLRRQVTQLNQRSRQLQSDYRQRRAARETLIATANSINQRRQTVQQEIQHTGQQINIANQELLAARAGNGASAGKTAEMNAEIQSLTTQKAELQAHNQQLADISSRLGV